MSMFDQWTTARPLIQGYPQWVSGEDQARIAAYQLYEELYWNSPTAYKLIQRGSDSSPIYVPAAKTIVETMHRYLAPAMAIVADPTLGTTGDQQSAMVWMSAFARRERLYSKFTTAKRYGLIRGDWCFIIRGDLDRAPGARVSIMEIDPASYFPVTKEDDIDVIIAQHIVEQIEFEGKAAIHRTTYRKTTGDGGPSPISVEETIFEADAWGGPGGMEEKPLSSVVPETLLPAVIDQLPVYHIQNFQQTGTMWGSSELRGLERLLGAINQSISDEELELVMNGLGVYFTDGGSPVDDDGNPTAWNLGPAHVVEGKKDSKFIRVSGTSSVTPYQDHLKYLHEQLDLGSGTPDVAKGIVDVTTAESGIALSLKLAPIFSRAVEKEQIVTDVGTNMLYDLRNWFAAYEGESFGDSVWTIAYGDRIPMNRAERFNEIMKLAEVKPPIVTAEWVRDELTKIGYVFAADIANNILVEQTAQGMIEADIVGARIDAELKAGETAGVTK